MSGPKGIAYQVRAAEEAQRRAFEAARGRCRGLWTQLLIAASELAVLTNGEDGHAPPAEANLDLSTIEACEMTERELRDRLVGVAERTSAAKLRLLESRLAHEFGPLLEFTLEPWDTASSRTGGPHASEVNERAKVSASLRRAVVLIERVDDEVVVRRLFSRADRVRQALLAGNSATARQQLVALQTEADSALATQRSLLALRERAIGAVLAIAHLSSAAADELRARAQLLRTPAEADDLQAEVRALAAEHHAEQDREYVIEQARRSLLELGYEVGEEFVAHGLSGEATVITRPDLADHGLRIQFTRPERRILTRVVTFAEPDPLRDEEVETATCADITRMREHLARQGVESELDHHREPGEVPLTRASSKRTRAAKQRSDRTLPR